LARDEARLRVVLADKARMAQPTLLLRPATERSGLSRLGGAPNLPPGVDWPISSDGPMGFLMQVDLAEARDADGPEWLPEAGRLCLFYDEDYGLAGQCRVLHLEGQAPIAVAPAALAKARRHPERSVGFQAFTSVPSTDWLDVELGFGDGWDELIDKDEQRFGDGPQHRLGGYPAEIQNEAMWVGCEHYARGLNPYTQTGSPPPELLAAAKSWRLLFQVDSDPALKTNWGDGGMLYVFIREEDARAGDFSKTVTLSQTG
jgi:uncharacterized protein YwqG